MSIGIKGVLVILAAAAVFTGQTTRGQAASRLFGPRSREDFHKDGRHGEDTVGFVA